MGDDEETNLSNGEEAADVAKLPVAQLVAQDGHDLVIGLGLDQGVINDQDFLPRQAGKVSV